jgi:hypothetical protein
VHFKCFRQNLIKISFREQQRYNGISPTKKNNILSFAGEWMELKNIILSEVSLVQKAKGHMLSLVCGI